MTTIFRFGLKITDYQEISIPTAYHVVSAAPARDKYRFNPGVLPARYVQGIDLWAKVSESYANTQLGVYIIGTGNPWPVHPATLGDLDLNFIDTCVMENGWVFHVFTGPLQNPLEP